MIAFNNDFYFILGKGALAVHVFYMFFTVHVEKNFLNFWCLFHKFCA